MSHKASQWATVMACPLWNSDSRRMPLWEGLVALYSLHAKVLTPCVGPLTPHLLSPLMWLYWLWHTEHGDDDQTIKSAPKGRAIRVRNHSTGFVSLCLYVHRLVRVLKCDNTQASHGGHERRVKFLSPHHPPSAHEYETELLGFLIYTNTIRDDRRRRRVSHFG